MDLTLSQTTFPTHAVVEVLGEVDVHSAPQLRDRLLAVLADEAPAVIVDLDQVAFIDSTGLGALVAGLNEAKERRVAFLVACSLERILRLFRITGLDEIFALYPSVEAATLALQPAAD